ncbi:hypothetical protein ABIA35_007611 [Catenulispora sp. MAP12-49]
MQKPSSRLLALLSLLQTHRDGPGGELTERDITSPAVGRDHWCTLPGYEIERAIHGSGNLPPGRRAGSSSAT